MELDRLSFGTPGALRAILEWKHDYGSDGPIGKTWGELQLWIGETLVWGQLDSAGKIDGITWSWIDLLEFIGNAWPYLIEEEQYPIIFNNRTEEQPRRLGELWGYAKLRWNKLADESRVEKEDALLRDFLVVHDFSEALQGARPPQLLFLRRGNQMIVSTAQHEWILPFESTMSTLKALSETIFAQLASLSDQRSEIARARWKNRDIAMSVSRRLQIATGMDEPSLQYVWPNSISADAANDNLYELKAAARMIGSKLPNNQLKDILEKINKLPNGKHLDLGPLHKNAADVIKEHENSSPAIQGYLLASMLREHLNCKTGKVEPKDILKQWGVTVIDFEIKNSLLDAIAVWGAKHAPTILLNTDGPRAKLPRGTRSTLAHEVCHLLVDIDGALPAAEVFGGNIPSVIEQRANAFAAEFLLPRSAAGNHLAKELKFVHTSDQRFTTTEETISYLAESYGASHETTAWQIKNSGSTELTNDVIRALNTHLKSISDPFGNNATE